MHEFLIRDPEVWKTCNKIKAAVLRVGLNLWEWYMPLDPEKNGLISESKFVSILAGPLRPIVGLLDKEISQLADYLRTQDGRVLYHQLCSLIHGGEMPSLDAKPECILEDCPPPPEPACHTLDEWQTMRLCCLLSTISSRQIPAEPYFQDYELISKNDGRITFAHFSRVLNYIGVHLSAPDFNLLVRKFIKDSYTLDYVEFLKAVEAVKKYGIKGLEAVPPPTRGFRKDLTKDGLGMGDAERTTVKYKRKGREPLDLLLTINSYIKEKKIKLSEFFRDFDPLNIGRVLPLELRKVLDMTGISSVVSPWDILTLQDLYKDPSDPTRFCWRAFEDELDSVTTGKAAEKPTGPTTNGNNKAAESTPRAGGTHDMTDLPFFQMRVAELDPCERAILRIRKAIRERGVDMRPFFKEHDKCNNGHIPPVALRKVLARVAVLPPLEQIKALELRYSDDLGCNYYRLLDELPERAAPVPAQRSARTAKVPVVLPVKEPGLESNILHVLAKIKGKVNRGDLPSMRPHLQRYDKLNENIISREDFYRGLAAAGLQLTPIEMDTIMEVFASPGQRRYIDYVRYCDSVGEAQPRVEPPPPLEPGQQATIKDTELNFLNFEERHIVSMALTKLAKFPDLTENIYQVFKDLDKENCGTITMNQLQRGLCQRDLLFLISAKELDVVAKCFGYKHGCCDEINYRALSNALHGLYTTLIDNPC